MVNALRALAICWLLPAALTAQVRAVASFDRSTLEAGDTAVLRVQVFGVRAAPQRVQMAAWMPTVPADNLRYRSAWRRSGEAWVQTITLTLLDTGRLLLPPLPVLLQVGEPVLTNALEITVRPPRVPADISAMAPIRDIRRQPVAWYDYWPAMLAAALVVVAVVWWVLRQRSAPPVPVPLPSPPSPSAQQVALEQLEALAREKPWMVRERLSEYYASLSWVVREYLQAQYAFDALEMTTADIGRHLKTTPMPAEVQREALHLLQQADWAKFAEVYPKADQHEGWLEVARRVCNAGAT